MYWIYHMGVYAYYIKCTYVLDIPYGYTSKSCIHKYWMYHMGIHVYQVYIYIGHTIWVYMYIRCTYVLHKSYGCICLLYQVYICIGYTIWMYMYIISGVHMYWIYHMGVYVYDIRCTYV